MLTQRTMPWPRQGLKHVPPFYAAGREMAQIAAPCIARCIFRVPHLDAQVEKSGEKDSSSLKNKFRGPFSDLQIFFSALQMMSVLYTYMGI